MEVHCNSENIYGAPPPPPEQLHEVIEDIQTILQVIQTQGYEMEGLAQENAVLTCSNSAVMVQWSQMTVTTNAIQAQLKILASAKTNQEVPERKHYCWSYGSNYTHGRKNF